MKISQQELLDISQEITQKHAPREIRQQPELVLMPVDPVNLYAYWNLRTEETDFSVTEADKPLTLRIYSLPELSENANTIKLSFDITVDALQNQKKVQLPVSATAYSAVLGKLNADNSFNSIVAANTIHVPRDKSVFADNVLKHVKAEQKPAPPVVTKTDRKQQGQADIDTVILENFNGQGYDLTVYANEIHAEFKQILSEHTQDTLSKKTAAIEKNPSSTGSH